MNPSLVIGLLGPLTVRLHGVDVPPPAGRQGQLLARLALGGARPVPTDVLVDELWDEPPGNAANALQSVVARLRRWLRQHGGDPDQVVTIAAAYRLDGATTDIDHVEELHAAATAARDEGDRETSARLLADAIACWRGAALGEYAYREWALPHVRRVEELRWQLHEERLADELELGRAERAVPELETSITANPLRERLWQLLMVALYRSGRQADALEAYQRARAELRDRLGVEPGPELVETESAILRQDPALRPVRAQARRRSNVPTPLTRLVGRDEALVQVSDRLAHERLITIVGPGGVGKTRFAVELAAATTRSRLDVSDVWFVDLAAVTSPEAVDESVAAVLQLRDTASAESVRAAVATAIGDRPVMLVLDNCEHLVDQVCAVAEELLGRCPRLRILATSREVLPVPGAVSWPLGPLSPDAASELFVERARAAAPGREDDIDRALVDGICRRLDRLPLAIELAAARVRVLSVAEVHERLDDRFTLLTGGSRPALRRQQTLRAVIDWSYELLFDDERTVFEHLSVFVGDFDLDGAEAVASASGVERSEIVTILTRLVEKSLIASRPGGRTSTFRMLESIAEYGRERLIERGGLDRALDAHGRHAVTMVTGSTAALSGERQLEFLDAVRARRPDLVAALVRLQEHAPVDALELATGLGWTWWVSGRVREGIQQLGRAIAATDGTVAPERSAWAAAWYSYLSFLVGEPDALERARRAECWLDESSPSVEAAYTASLLSEIHTVGGDPERGLSLARRSVSLASAVGEHDGLLDYLRARVALGEGRMGDAERAFAASAEQLEAAGEYVIRSLALSYIADFADRRGDHERSIDFAVRAVETGNALGLENASAALTVRLGHALVNGGELDRARSVLLDSLAAGKAIGFPPTTCAALGGLASIEWLRGDVDRAGDLARQSLADASSVGLWSHVVIARCILVGCSLHDDRFGAPDELAAEAVRAAERSGDPRSTARAGLAVARAIAGDDPVAARAEIARVEAIWSGNGLVPSTVERAELDDAQRRLGRS